MEWTDQQRGAISQIQQWLESPDSQVFTLGGYAGTGKTSIALDAVSRVRGTVYFAATTGKAAQVMASKGIPNTSTIHKLVYTPKTKSQQHLAELNRKLLQAKAERAPAEDIAKLEAEVEAEGRNLMRPLFNLNLESPLRHAELLVIDEYSMVDEKMGEDLLSFGCRILALGDPGQLPPVGGKPFFSAAPRVSLTEIHRQAAGDPILQLATAARQGKEILPGVYGPHCRVVRHRDVSAKQIQEWVVAADQVLAGRNATRVSSNFRIRELLGRSDPMPEPGDKLVCLRNNGELGIMNGQQFTVERADPSSDGKYLWLNVRSDEGAHLVVKSHKDYFQGGKPNWYTLRDADEFDWGYVMTVHKAQGSQWDNVVVFDEWFRDGRREWLYTAITRAAKSLTLIQM